MTATLTKNRERPRETFGLAAYGGAGWSQRVRSHAAEIGDLWTACGINSEWAPLQAVLLHRPGEEISPSEEDHDAIQMLAPVDIAKARAEHDVIAETYRDLGIEVHYVDPAGTPSPNLMFCADLSVMTPQGAILARPASTVRAGEERQVARRLAELGMPVVRTLTGTATFEGADLMWLHKEAVVIGRGLRTNQEAIDQISTLLAETGVKTHAFDMPFGTMHFMGMLRIVDKDLVIAWPRRTPHAAVATMLDNGFQVAFAPDEEELKQNHAFNIVTLGPRKIMMVAGNPNTQAFYESLGIETVVVGAHELGKAAGATGCLTGILRRELI
ncbi:amidinotransferase [Mesorhizobium loti]|nr:arginine deiminase family protein [Mesorhizobium loti]PLP58025.1 amidinotransferase [Mesorhizobium loti]